MTYGLIVSLQQDLIEKYCFENCGKINIGAVIDERFGELVICSQDDCPYLEKQMLEPISTTADGTEIFLRKLKSCQE